MPRIRIARAGWSLPKEHQVHFPLDGSHLSRYAAVFDGVEINSSFYRHHRPETYARWSSSVPETFRFAVKVHRAITHDTCLRLPPLLMTQLPHNAHAGRCDSVCPA